MRYLIVVVGRDCEPWAQRCMDSLAALEGPHEFQVCVVDDCSEDGTWDVVQPYCDEQGWLSMRADSIRGAMRNQAEAWRAMEPANGDVVIWCDLDDRLAHPHVLDVLDGHYRRGALLTYGNYRPDPPSETCPDVRPYPPSIIRQNKLRSFALGGGGFRYNHLRTVSWDVLQHITDRDMQDSEGNWWQSGPDAAIMIPSLELAGRRHAVINEVLYIYTSDNPYSEWRRWPKVVNTNHREMLRRRPKRPLRR